MRREMREKKNPNIYENIQHVGKNFSKVIISCVRNSTYHWHNDYELLAVLKGKIEIFYRLYGAEPQRLAAGDLILVNSEEVHGVRGIELDNICVCIQFSPELFGVLPGGMKYYFYLNSISKEYNLKYSRQHYMNIVAQIAYAYRSETQDSCLREKAWLYMLLADILTGAPCELRSNSGNSTADMEIVLAIKKYIDENLMSEDIFKKIHKKFGFSESGLYILLKNEVGLTLKEMINIARIEQACSLLLDTELPLPIVAERCGYLSGSATFYRRFKNAMGVTPGEYRKGVQTNSVSSDIQDYLSFDESELDELLKYYIKMNENT